jgi:uncharacterized OB-fold protein
MSPRRRLRSVPAPVETVQTPPLAAAGHSLSEKEFRDAVGAIDFEVQARYAWDAGVAVGRYLHGLREGRIMARECLRCRRTLVPPRMFCEQCFRPTDRWVEVRDTGRVNTFSICYIRWDMVKLDEPEIPAVIEIDGASAGMGFMHKPEGDREGSILDIRYFRPREAKLRTSKAPRSGTKGPRAKRGKPRAGDVAGGA